MATFCKLDENNIVIGVEKVADKNCLDENGNESEAVGIAFLQSVHGGGTYVQTSVKTKKGKHFTSNTYETKVFGKERYDDPTRVGLTKYESVEQALKDFNMGPTVGARVPDLDNPTEAGFRLLDDLEKKLADRPIDRSQEINDVRDLKQQMRVRQEMLTGEGGVEFPMEVWKSEGYYDIFFHSNKVVPRRKLRTKPGEGGVIPKVGEGGPPGKRKQQQERIARQYERDQEEQ